MKGENIESIAIEKKLCIVFIVALTYVATNSVRRHLHLPLKFPRFLPYFNHVCIFSTRFHRSSQYSFYGTLPLGYRTDTRRRTDMTKLVSAFRDCTNAPTTPLRRPGLY